MKKYYWVVIVIAAVALAAVLLSSRGPAQVAENQPASPQKASIITSIFPLYDFAKNIGGEHAAVVTIVPAGTEPHDYEPTGQDIAKAYGAKLFIINGNGVDGWGEKIEADLKARGVAVVKISDHLDSLRSNAPEEEFEYDPHFWLNPVNAQKQADLIADALVKVDPAHEKEYNQNRISYKQQLAELDGEYKTGLAACRQKEIVTAHNAFNYMASQYGLGTIYIQGISPDEEPSPKAIADVANVAKQKGIKYIFFETLVSPKLSQTVADEIGARTLELNPIEGFTDEQIAQGKNYITQMRANLSNLRIALECK